MKRHLHHICAGCHEPMPATQRRTCSEACARRLAVFVASLHRSHQMRDRLRDYWREKVAP